MVRRDDQEGARFLSNPIRGGNNDIPAPNQHSRPTSQLPLEAHYGI
jgi:hypothetical protein